MTARTSSSPKSKIKPEFSGHKIVRTSLRSLWLDHIYSSLLCPQNYDKYWRNQFHVRLIESGQESGPRRQKKKFLLFSSRIYWMVLVQEIKRTTRSWVQTSSDKNIESPGSFIRPDRNVAVKKHKRVWKVKISTFSMEFLCNLRSVAHKCLHSIMSFIDYN